MGMFDEMRVEAAMPDGYEKYQEFTFQTKDTPAQYLGFYIITPDGRLVERFREHKDHPTEKRWQPLLKRHVPERVLAREWAEDLNYHGDIVFYPAWLPEEYVEFRARFTDGCLVWIKVG